MARLTTMWHLILGVPSTRDWSAYELAEQIDNGVTEVWPRARRLLYKRAQASRQAGLITADKQATGQPPTHRLHAHRLRSESG